jgi:AcrR family transcriptional regulator
MARPLDPGIRASLRDKAIDYVLAHGIVDFSLRALAKPLGTSARMLVYHFGSREGLMREILMGLRQREDARIGAWMSEGEKAPTLSDFLHWYWQEMSTPRARPAVRLIFELYALALCEPRAYPGVLTDPLAYWRKLARETGVATKRRDAEATLLLAASRGLLLDLCATKDSKRIDSAMTLLVGLLNNAEDR